MEYEELMEENLSEEFDYMLTQRKIQEQIMKEWNLFKSKLLNSELNSDIRNELQNFDKLLKYWL